MHRSSHYRSLDSRPYATSAYDEDMCLKPPLLLWLAVLFLSRAITLPILIGIGHIAGVNTDAMQMLRSYWSEHQLIPAVFSFPVLCALCRRLPTASGVVRRVWSHGRLLLLLASVLDLSVPLLRLLWPGDGAQISSIVTVAGIDFYFLAYLLAARRVHDTFLDFPSPLNPKGEALTTSRLTDHNRE